MANTEALDFQVYYNIDLNNVNYKNITRVLANDESEKMKLKNFKVLIKKIDICYMYEILKILIETLRFLSLIFWKYDRSARVHDLEHK